MQGIMGMLPGVAKMKKQIAESGMSDKSFRRQEASRAGRRSIRSAWRSFWRCSRWPVCSQSIASLRS